MERGVMPIERLYENYESDPTRVVIVAWGREREVQVATGPIPQKDSTGVDIDEGCIFTTLDRHQVNDLIRTLRRARDQAYGCDE